MSADHHLDMLINRSYLDGPEPVYLALMAHKAVVVAEREKEESNKQKFQNLPF